jgi:glycosyltransferase involved in cell wall biosynthesis
MTISVIVPFVKGDKERIEGLHIMWGCIKRQTYRDFELILAEMTQDGTTVYLPYKPDKHIVKKYAGIFNKSWMCNVAVREASYENLIFLDADTQFDDGYFQRIIDYHQEKKHKFFVCWRKCVMLAGRDEPTPRVIDSTHMKAAAHCWFVEKPFYWKTGGMHEKYFGYGAEDQDFWERSRFFIGDIQNMPDEIKHTYHHFHPKDSAFPLNPRRVQLKEETMREMDLEIKKLVTRQDKLGRDVPYGNCNDTL